jgi:hypothetical protein
MDVLSRVSVVCGQVEVSASDSSLAQSSPTDLGMSKCNHESSKIMSPSPSRAVAPWKKRDSDYSPMFGLIKGSSPPPPPIEIST